MKLNLSLKTARQKIAGVITQRFPALRVRLACPEAKKLLVNVLPYSIDIVDDRNHRMICLNRRNAVYISDMLNHFDYYFNSAESIIVWRGRSSYQCVDFSTPRYQHVNGFDDFPLMCPSLTEPFITTIQYLDFAQLTLGGVVLDLGSYSGLTSIAFSKEVGTTGRVIALEPDPINHGASRINIVNHERINKISNISLMQAAAHAKRGILKFSAEGAMGSAEMAVVGAHRGNVVDVDSYSLLDIARLHHLDKVDFIKMDIEGAEEKVLAVAGEFFSLYKPRVIVEPHVVDGSLSLDGIIGILKEFNYRCEVIQQYGVSLPLVTAWPI